MTNYQMVSDLRGRQGRVSVVFKQCPVRLNARGEHCFPHDEFGMYLADILTVSPPWATAKGFFSKKMHCRSCKAPLDFPGMQGTQRFEYRVDHDSNHRFDPAMPAGNLLIEAPAVICPSCGTANMEDDEPLVSELFDALAGALKQIDHRL